jgi:hypothetical protein
VCGAVLLACLVTVSAATAQVPTGVVDGRAVDVEGLPLPGVLVEVSGPDLMGTRTAYTGANGRFRFAAMPRGEEYVVTFSMSGFKTVVREGIIIRLNTTTTIDVILELTGVEETITVTGESPVVDVRSTNVGVNVTSDHMQNVPNARDVWVVLEEVPAMVMDRFNVGGSESGQQSGFSAGGGESQNAYNFDGIDITDMAATGAATYFPYDAFEEVQVSTSAHKAEVAAPGVFLNIVTRSGSNAFHGLQAFYWQGPALQADNIDAELEDAGVTEGDEFKRYLDFTISLGGKIIQDKVWFYATYQHQQPEIYPIGFSRADGSRGVDSTALKHWLVKLDWQVTPQHKIAFSEHYGVKDRPWRNGVDYIYHGAGTLLEQISPKHIPQIHWNSLWGDRAFADISFGMMLMDFPLAPDQDNQGLTSLYEYRTITDSNLQAEPLPGWRRGYHQSYYRYNQYYRDRYQVNGTFSYYQDDWGGDHDFKTGANWYTFKSDTGEYSFNSLRQGYRYGVPYNIRTENHPQQRLYDMDSFGVYFQDTWTLNDKVTLNLGIRGDGYTTYLPEQSQGATPFCSIWGDRYEQYCPQTYAAVDDVAAFFNFAPRVGIIYDVNGDGRTAIKANWSRYYNQLGNWIADFTNPNSYIYQYWYWTDRNGNGAWDPGEEADNPYSTYTAAANRVDPDLTNPYTDEFVFGVDHELIENLAIGATYTYRKDKNLAEDVLYTIPWDAYTLVTFEDDRVPGGSYVAYELDEAWVGEAESWEITNPGEIDGQPFENEYQGFTVKAIKRMSDNWQLLGSYTWSRTLGWRTDAGDFASSVGDNPNDNLFAYGRPFYDRPHLIKVSGSVVLPYDVSLGTFVRFQSGEPFAREIETARRLNQGWVEVRVEEPGASRYPNVFTVDLRVGKIFELPLGNLEAMFDVFNLTNGNVITDQGTIIGDTLGTVEEILPPRIARIGVKWTF